ncbi:MAG: peptidoglycan-associated lipoprotein Pal [Desulfobacterales bacterium]|jgi:peptidoglycan-associated lipoprotein|nr:peptidoglycan-associated lipoprotein Pal [Desulfobacterales bacterium]
MNTKIWRCLLLLLIIPGLLTTVACSKKAVKQDTGMTTSSAVDEAELERQRRLAEEARMREEALRNAEQAKMEARQKFENEDVYFAFDSAALSMDAQAILKEKAQWLAANPDASTTIEGHCDERGTNAYNLALGDRRANSAKSFLVNMGIADSRMSAISYGEERPVDPDHNEAAWAKNRRAHFVLP